MVDNFPIPKLAEFDAVNPLWLKNAAGLPGFTDTKYAEIYARALLCYYYYYYFYYFLAHEHKACRQMKIKQEMTAVGD